MNVPAAVQVMSGRTGHFFFLMICFMRLGYLRICYSNFSAKFAALVDAAWRMRLDLPSQVS
jgi:hypothetical protein